MIPINLGMMHISSKILDLTLIETVFDDSARDSDPNPDHIEKSHPDPTRFISTRHSQP